MEHLEQLYSYSSIDGKASRNIYDVRKTDSHVDINILLMLVVKQHDVNYILCYNVKLIPMLVLIYIRTYVRSSHVGI